MEQIKAEQPTPTPTPGPWELLRDIIAAWDAPTYGDNLALIDNLSGPVHAAKDALNAAHVNEGNVERSEHIVRCVNAHEELVQALEKAKQRIIQLSSTVNTLAKKQGIGRKVYAEDFYDCIDNALAKAHA